MCKFAAAAVASGGNQAAIVISHIAADKLTASAVCMYVFMC